METTPPPPPSAGEPETLVIALAAAAAAAKEEKVKRARKRSRYLSPPYTDAVTVYDITPEQDKQDKDDKASLLLHLQEANVSAADLLSALLQSAAGAAPPSPNVYAGVLLRFFALYRTSLLAKPVDAREDDDAAVGDRVLLDTHRAMPAAAAAAAKKQGDAMGCASAAHHIGRPANPAPQTGRKRNKDAATDFSARSTGDVADAPAKMKKTRKRYKYFGNPAALVLDFTQDAADLPSREELLSAFRRFGFVIESETDITRDARRARVVFGSSAEAETAYSCAHTLGAFGPPFTVPQLQYLPPIKLNVPRPPPSPAPKLPLTDMRKNLEMMILSLTHTASRNNGGAHNLAGEMRGLLAKVDKVLSAGTCTTTGHHH